MFKRILLSLGVITVVGGSAIVGTQALLSDNVSLTANTFSTGSVELKIWDGDSYEDTTTGFSATLFPGQPSGPHVVWLKNNNSGVSFDISAIATVTTETISSDDVMVTLVAMDNAGTTQTGTPVTQTLTAWETSTALGLPTVPTNGEQRYHMTVTIDPDVTTSGATSAFDFTFTGTQVAS